MAIEVDALSPSVQRCYAGFMCAFPNREQNLDFLLVAGDDSECSCLLWLPVFEFRGVFLLMSSRRMIPSSLYFDLLPTEHTRKHESLPEGYVLMSRACRCFFVVHVYIISSWTRGQRTPPPPPRVLSLLMCVIDSYWCRCLPSCS